MKKIKMTFWLLALLAALGTWATDAMAKGSYPGIVAGTCGTAPSCSACHTNSDSYNCGSNAALCTPEQVAFLAGDDCFFCPDSQSCSQSGCQTDADCDNQDLCDGMESCGAGGQCQTGTPLTCGQGESCDSALGCVSQSQCLRDSDCDDGLYCNGPESCNSSGGCETGVGPCLAGESCDESDGCRLQIGELDGAQLYGQYCASCHGDDARGGASGEDVRGESGSEIREAIREEHEMQFLDFLTYDEVQMIALFLAAGSSDDDYNDDDCSDDDYDRDGMCDSHEGYDRDDSSDDDDSDVDSDDYSDDDGIPDYADPRTTHFPSDNHAGSMVLKTSDGQLISCSTVNESSGLSDRGRPEGVDFRWGFIDFTVSGLPPFGSAEITLIAPEDIPEGARYWKHERDRYFSLDDAVIEGRKVTFILTDDDGDGIAVDPGAVGIPAVGGSSGGGGGGCAMGSAGISHGEIDLAMLSVMLIPGLFFLRGSRKKN